MNDFSAIFELLARLVSTLVDWSINLFCLLLLVFSFAAPWRWSEIVHDMYRRDMKWKLLCCRSFLLTLLDTLQIVFLCVGLLSPFRWMGTFALLARLLFSSCVFPNLDDDHFRDSRFFGFFMPVCVLCDLVCFPFGLFVLINPFGRQFVLFKVMGLGGSNNNARCFSDDEDDINVWVNLDMNIAIIKYGLQGCLDILVGFSFLLVPFVPSVWQGLIRGVLKLHQNYPLNLPQLDSSYNRKKYYKAWNEWFEDMRELFFNKFLNALVDLGVAPFLFIAAVVPFRNGQLMKLFAAHNPPAIQETNTIGPDGVLITPPSDSVGHIPTFTSPPPPPLSDRYVGDFEYEYDYALRKEIVYLGILALSDLLLMFMLVPLWITRYRYRAIADALYPPSNPEEISQGVVTTQVTLWGYKQLYLISSQFLWLVGDLLCLSVIMPLLFLTQFRWHPIGRLLSQEKVFLDQNLTLYKTVYYQMLLFVLDLLSIPFLLLIFGTVYRMHTIVPFFQSQRVREDGFHQHYRILRNTFIVLHDCLLFTPVMLLMVTFAPHRLPVVVNHLFYKPYVRPATIGNTASDPNKAFYEWNSEQQARFRHDVRNRMRCWEEWFTGLFEVPFFLMAAIVLLTIWRATQMIHRIRTIEPLSYYYARRRETRSPANRSEEPVVVQYPYVELVESAPYFMKQVVWKEFVGLGKDVLTLIPMSIIIGTLYRIPELWNSFRNALQADPLRTAALLEVTSFSLDYPLGKDPIVKVIMTGDVEIMEQLGSRMHLHVLGHELWQQTNQFFGGLIAGLAKSYLPLTLIPQDSMGWKVVQVTLPPTSTPPPPITPALDLADITIATAEVDVEPIDPELQQAIAQSLQPARTANGIELWFQLPLKAVKKSTVLKKLKKFDTTTPMIWQVECDHCVTSMNNTKTKAKEVLFRLLVPMGQVIEVLEREEELHNSWTTPSPTILTDTTTLSDVMGTSSTFVDAFHLLVVKVFVEVMLDVAHLLLFLFTFLNPFRMVKVVRCMVESATNTNVRLLQKLLYTYQQAEIHLRTYRACLTPGMNSLCKTNYGQYLAERRRLLERPRPTNAHEQQQWDYTFAPHMPYISTEALVDFQSIYDHQRYKSLLASAKRDLALLNSSESVENFVDHVQKLSELHDTVMWCWYLKYAAWFGHHSWSTRHDMELASFVCEDEHDLQVKQLIATKAKLLKALQAEQEKASAKRGCSLPGFLKRSTEQNRSLIRAQVRGLITDYVGLVMISLLVITMIRFFPFLRDIWHQRVMANEEPLSLRAIVSKHCRALRHDLYFTGMAVVYTILVFATVVNVPAFLAEVVTHLHSIKAVALCARHHFAAFFDKLCEFLALITLFRTYRMVFKAALYCVLLPGAFVGDCLGITAMSEEIQFVVGSVIYFGILAGCLVSTVAINITNDATLANNALLAICGTIVGVLGALGILRWVHSISSTSTGSSHAFASQRLKLSWSHCVGLFLGPCECIQLSGIVMFFFWNPITISRSSSVTTILDLTTLQLGSDSLSPVLFWHSVDTLSTAWYNTSLSIALALVFAWAIVVALPIVQGGDESSGRRQEKMLAVRNSAVYDSLYMLLCHVLSVWLLSMLLRASSCGEEMADIDQKTSVLTTAWKISCGDQSFWTSNVALSFFSFYAITSALAYSDSTITVSLEATDATSPKGLDYVRFSAWYTLWGKATQVFICGACFGAFSTVPALPVLIPMLFVTICFAAVPLLVVTTTSKQSTICNVPGIVPFRSAGYLATAWTVLVCLIRSCASTPADLVVIFDSEAVVYVGWGIIFCGAALVTAHLERKMYLQWQATLLHQGLQDALEALLSTYRSAWVEAADGGNKQSLFVQGEESTAILRTYEHNIRQCRSLPELIELIKSLEHIIRIDKLSDEFLSLREEWLFGLTSIASSELTDATPLNRLSLLSLNDVENQSPILPSHTQAVAEFAPTTVTTTTGARGIHLSCQHILTHLTILRTAFRPQPVTTTLSREVITILLTRKLPRDVVWYLFTYLWPVTKLREVLIDRSWGLVDQPNYRLQHVNPISGYRSVTHFAHVQRPKLQKTPSKEYAHEMLQQSLQFFFIKHEALLQAIEVSKFPQPSHS